MSQALVALHDDHPCCPRCTLIADLLRAYANGLALRDWEFQVAHEEPFDPGALAEIEMAAGRKLARVRVAAAWDDHEPEERRHALVHELVHAHARDMEEFVREGARGEFGGAAYRLFVQGLDRELERMVDALATAVEPVLPLP